ncbi:MAG: hypothetical protein MIO92_12850 [Methanosarcinaceae archaeon]|nr:hypothetical protein [Methanosarcinaceae archaeon]
MYPKLKKFLNAQIARLENLDEAEGLSKMKNIAPVLDEEGNPTGQSGMLTIYQNMASYLLREKALQYERSMLEQTMNEETLSTDIAAFTTMSLPLVRRIIRGLVTLNNGLVSMQPIKTPTAEIFFAKRTYDSTYGDATAGEDVADNPGEYRYAQSSEKGTIRKLSLGITHKLVTAISMKLASDFTWESEQNMLAYHGINEENEIKSLFTEEIQVETDNYLVQAMLAGAGYNVNWANAAPIGDTTTLDKKAYYETLYTTGIVGASMRILEKMHVPAGWIIISPTVLGYLMRSESFKLTGDINNLQTQAGLQQVGAINGLLRVFVSPTFATNKILVGCNSTDWARTAAVYAPFLPISFSPKYITNDMSQFSMGAMSRFWAGILPQTYNGTTTDALATVTISSS